MTLDADLGQTLSRGCIGGVERQRLREVAFGERAVAGLQFEGREIRIGRGISWIGFERLVKSRSRFVAPTQAPERGAGEVVGTRVQRVHGKDALSLSERQVHALLHEKQRGTVVMGGFGVRRHRA